MFLLKKLIRLFSVKTMIKFLVSEREDTHYVFDDVIKEYIKNIIQTGEKFLTIHIKY